MVRLGDVCELIRNGVSIKQNKRKDGYPITRIETISDGIVDREKMGYAGIVQLDKYKDYLLKNGDILMSHINSEKHLGKVAYYENKEGEIIIHGMNLLFLRIKQVHMNSRYAFFIFNSPFFKRQIPRITKKSVNQASFTVTALRELNLISPPLTTQKHIVDTLDKTQEIIDCHKKQLAELDNLIKAAFYEMFQRFFPDKLMHMLLPEICTFIDYRGKTPEKSNRGIPLITAKNIKNNTFSIEPREFIPESNYDKVMTRGIPEVNDVIFTTEAPLGNVCRIPKCLTRFAVGQRIIVMQPNKELVTSEYLEYALASEEFQNEMLKRSSGSTVRGIRSKELVQLAVCVPPIQLQMDFTKIVTKIEEQKAIVKQAIAESENLFNSLMSEYFD